MGSARGLTSFTPSSDRHERGRGNVERRAPQSMVRRFLTRFGLIAFGLYHLPLFLNNYPSLGGGGGPIDGPAVRWGHVFTPVGVWVARIAFHVTSPSPEGYRGDNGDVAEEFGRLLFSVVVAIIGAIVWTVADRKRPRGFWVDAALRVLLRYAIILGIASYAVSKILPQQFPPLTAVSLEGKIGEQSPAGLLWSFMQYSRPYSFFGGVMELVVLLLLCFRRTATLGAIVCLVVMTNVMALDIMYDVRVKLYATMMVVSAAVLLLYDARRLLAVFVTNEAAPAAALSIPLLDRIPNVLRWTLKTALVGSVLVSSLISMPPFKTFTFAPASAVDGGWELTSFTRDGQRLDSTANPARWRRFAADGYSVAIRLESDSLLVCQRAAPPSPSVVRFSCRGKREGELQWTRTGDTVRLDGTFGGATVTASGRNLHVSDYRLLRSKPRLIVDR